jgi:primosomal protein N' (replication factor Y)
VDVLFNIALPKTFTYRIPQEIQLILQPGQRVLAPLGKRELTGIVARVSDHSDFTACREIVDVLEDIPLVLPELMEFTSWLAEYYLCSWGQTVQLALPRGLEQKSESVVRFHHFPRDDDLLLSGPKRHLLDLVALNSGKSTAYYRKQFGSGSFYHYLHELHEQKFIQIEQRLKKPARSRMLRLVRIGKPIDDKEPILRKHPDLNGVLAALKDQDLSYNDFKALVKLSAPVINRLIHQGFLFIEERAKSYQTGSAYPEEKKEIRLNTEQQRALAVINEFLQRREFKTFLLYGVTGSGKTQVYLEAIKSCLDLGLTAIVLIPEIALTPQTVSRFDNYFPGRAAVFHSKMSRCTSGKYRS